MRFGLPLFGLNLLIVCAALMVARQPAARTALVTYVSDRSGSFDLYTMLPDGSNALRRTHFPQDESSPVWLSDGRHITFIWADNQGRAVHLMKINGTDHRVLPIGTADFVDAVVAPQGNWIVIEIFETSVFRLYRVSFDGSEWRPLFDPQSPTSDHSAAWSSDGEWLAFSAYADGETNIYKMRADGSERQQLTYSLGDDTGANWSPDDEWLVFTSYRDGRSYDLYRMRSNGGEVVRLTNTQENEWNPSWSPNGEWILFSTGSLNTDLFLIRPDGTGRHRLTNTSDAFESWGEWSPIIDLPLRLVWLLAAGFGFMSMALLAVRHGKIEG